MEGRRARRHGVQFIYIKSLFAKSDRLLGLSPELASGPGLPLAAGGERAFWMLVGLQLWYLTELNMRMFNGWVASFAMPTASHLLNPDQSSEQLRDRWRAYLRGWWAYYDLAEERRNIFDLEGWIRRHMRKCFWQRWHSVAGRLRHLKQLGASSLSDFAKSDFI